MDDKDEEFISGLLGYFEKSMGDISNSIIYLASIQKKYSEEYEKFKKINDNPEILLNLELSDKLKGILFELLLRSSTLNKRISSLILLTPIEKEELANDLKSYVNELRNKINEAKNK